MSIFDPSPDDYSPGLDPTMMGLIGAAGGFAQGAMPVARKGGLPFGMTLGLAAQGMGSGAGQAYQAQEAQQKAIAGRMQNYLAGLQLPLQQADINMQLKALNNPQFMQNLLRSMTGQEQGSPTPTTTTSPQPSGPGALTPFVGANLPQGVTPAEDQMVRTVWGEARGEPLAGQQAVAHVIRNRMAASNANAQDIIFAKNQFEPWNNPETRKSLEGLDPTDPAYQSILTNAVRPVMSGTAQDPTGGATYFVNPKLQAQLGREQPSFAQGNRTTIGSHDFYYGPGNFAGKPAATATAAATGPLYLGDSYTSPGGIGGTAGQGKVGADPDAVLKQITGTDVNGRDVVLSSGVANDPSKVALVQQQLEALQKGKAKSITLVGAAPQFANANLQLQQLAAKNGIKFQPMDASMFAAPGQIHPSQAGYMQLTQQTQPPAASATAPAAAPSVGGGIHVPTSPADAIAQSNQLLRQAQSIEMGLKRFPWLGTMALSQGITLPDPAALREQAKELLQTALAPGKAGATKLAEQQALAATQPQIAGAEEYQRQIARLNTQPQIVGQEEAARLVSQLALKPQLTQAEEEAKLRAQIILSPTLTEAQKTAELKARTALEPTLQGKIKEAEAPFQMTPMRPGSIMLDHTGKVRGFAPIPSEEQLADGSYVSILRSPVDNSVIGQSDPHKDPAVVPEATKPVDTSVGAKPPHIQLGVNPPSNAIIRHISPTAQELLKGAGEAQVKDYDRDQTELDKAATGAAQTQSQMARYYEMRDLARRMPQSGFAGPEKAQVARMLDSLVPGMTTKVGDFLKSSVGLPSSAVSDQLAKLTLQAAGQQENEAVGKKGGLGLTKMYVQLNPGLSTMPDANEAMSNFFLAQGQADLDYHRGLYNYVTSHAADFRRNPTGGYTSSTQFDKEWFAEDNQKLYLAAADAMTHRPYSGEHGWTRYLGTGAEANQRIGKVLDIIRRIDPTATIMWHDSTDPRPVFAPQAGGG